MFIIMCLHPKEIPPPHAAAGFFRALFYRKNLNYKIWEASASVEIWEPCLPPFPHITYFNKSIASQCILHVKLHIVYLKGVSGLSWETVKPQSSHRGCNFVAEGLMMKLILSHYFYSVFYWKWWASQVIVRDSRENSEVGQNLFRF